MNLKSENFMKFFIINNNNNLIKLKLLTTTRKYAVNIK